MYDPIKPVGVIVAKEIYCGRCMLKMREIGHANFICKCCGEELMAEEA